MGTDPDYALHATWCDPQATLSQPLFVICCEITGCTYTRRTGAAREAITEFTFFLASFSLSDGCAPHMGVSPDHHWTAPIPPPYRLACCKVPPGGRRKKVEKMQKPEAGYARPCVKIAHCREPSRSHLGANAECRMAGQSHHMRHQSHLNATSRPVDSQLIATPMRPQCVYKATPRPP
jgi:hypothetical protein